MANKNVNQPGDKGTVHHLQVELVSPFRIHIDGKLVSTHHSAEEALQRSVEMTKGCQTLPYSSSVADAFMGDVEHA